MPKPKKDSRPSPAEVEKNFRAELEGRLAEMRKPKNPTFAGLPPELSDFVTNKGAAFGQSDIITHQERLTGTDRSVPFQTFSIANPDLASMMKILSEWNKPNDWKGASDPIMREAEGGGMQSAVQSANGHLVPAKLLEPQIRIWGDPEESYNKLGLFQPKRTPYSVGLQAKYAAALPHGFDSSDYERALNTLAHEASHYFQSAYAKDPRSLDDTPTAIAQAYELRPSEETLTQNFNKEFGSNMYVLDENNKPVKSKLTGKYILPDPSETVANVFGTLMVDLLKAKKENDYQTSIGLRPH